MGHGMCIPSVALYTKEQITDYGVKPLIRFGSFGMVRDVAIDMGANTDSKSNRGSRWPLRRRRRVWRPRHGHLYSVRSHPERRLARKR